MEYFTIGSKEKNKKFPTELSNQIYVININEEKKNLSEGESYKMIKELNSNTVDFLQKKSIIVVCSQNSLSGTSNHFQHWFSEYIKKNENLNNFKMISKIDATPQKRRRIGLFQKQNSNVRIRVYFNEKSKILKKLHLFNVDPSSNHKINFTNSYNTSKPTNFLTNTRSKVIPQNQIIPTFKKDLIIDTEKKFLITGYGLIRNTQLVPGKDDEGIITIGFRFSKYIPPQKRLLQETEEKVENYFLYITNKSQNYSNSGNLQNLQNLKNKLIVIPPNLKQEKKNNFLKSVNEVTKTIHVTKNSNNVKTLKISTNTLYSRNNVTSPLLGNNRKNSTNNNNKFKEVVDALSELTGMIISLKGRNYSPFLPEFHSNYNQLLKGEFKDFMDMMISILLIYKIMKEYRKTIPFLSNNTQRNNKNTLYNRIKNTKIIEEKYKTIVQKISSYNFNYNNTNNNKQSFLDNIKFIVEEFPNEKTHGITNQFRENRTYVPQIVKDILTKCQETKPTNSIAIKNFKNFCMLKLIEIKKNYENSVQSIY